MLEQLRRGSTLSVKEMNLSTFKILDQLVFQLWKITLSIEVHRYCQRLERIVVLQASVMCIRERIWTMRELGSWLIQSMPVSVRIFLFSWGWFSRIWPLEPASPAADWPWLSTMVVTRGGPMCSSEGSPDPVSFGRNLVYLYVYTLKIVSLKHLTPSTLKAFRGHWLSRILCPHCVKILDPPIFKSSLQQWQTYILPLKHLRQANKHILIIFDLSQKSDTLRFL